MVGENNNIRKNLESTSFAQVPIRFMSALQRTQRATRRTGVADKADPSLAPALAAHLAAVERH